MTQAIDTLRANSDPRLIVEQGVAARVAAIVEPVLIGTRLPTGPGEGFGTRRLHRSDHGRTAGRHDEGGGLRDSLARALAGARRRRIRSIAPIGSKCPRPGSIARWCGARISNASPAMSSRWRWRPRLTAGAGSAACCWGWTAPPRAFAARDAAAGEASEVAAAARGHGRGQARPHRGADRRIAQARQGGGTCSAATAGECGTTPTKRREGMQDREGPSGPSSDEGKREWGGCRPQRRRMTDGRQRQPAELLAIAASVANEKLIDKSIVIEAMEEAIQKSARSLWSGK